MGQIGPALCVNLSQSATSKLATDCNILIFQYAVNGMEIAKYALFGNNHIRIMEET